MERIFGLITWLSQHSSVAGLNALNELIVAGAAGKASDILRAAAKLQTIIADEIDKGAVLTVAMLDGNYTADTCAALPLAARGDGTIVRIIIDALKGADIGKWKDLLTFISQLFG